jgi:hypothetical protein
VVDTLGGLLRWDPSTQSLEIHLYDAIRQRAKREAAHAMRFPHSSVDAGDDDGESSVMTEAEMQLLADAPEATAETIARATEIAVALRQIATGKPLVIRLLDAFAGGATTKDDAMRVAQMTSTEYYNARRQLARLVDQLPEHLQPNRRVLAKGA